ncbi:signal peptidase II [Dyella mobilis]|uniref:Lipoprotein signal peptidase n=1 Tax=Dyella mobilis TaxID=1849582 RepID=A0ABS2KC72_9GAMM|nr:signal peptidase II [Dyella mobilis]MBM7128367.1 signal peptidase II [Dyella mobilis]
MLFKSRIIWALLGALAWIVADQLSKAFFKDMLKPDEVLSLFAGSLLLLPSYNHGAFLSLGANLPLQLRNLVFTYGVIALLAGLLIWVIRSERLRRMELIAVASILGGGLSNLLDRCIYGGQVFDFLNLGVGNLRTGIFNVADVGITFGVVLLILGSFLQRSKRVA